MIRERSEELHAFHARHFAERVGERRVTTNGHRSELTDEEIIKLAKGAKNAAKFEALWSGDTSGYPSRSEADQALVSLLTFYTRDAEQLDRLYRHSGLCRQKWLDRRDYRHSTLTRALSTVRETYRPEDGAQMVVGSNGNLVSRRPDYYRDGTRDTKPRAVSLAEVQPPGPRRYLCQGLVLAAYVTLLHGDGGVAKSLLALALAVAVAGRSQKWLGRRVEHGRVLYLDFELDGEEQARRVHQLCRGAGLEKPPEDLLYMSAVGHRTREAFEAAREACEEYDVELLVVDSYGVALHGDAENARDVIGFHQEYLEPLRALGIAVFIIDHQSRLQAGQSYQQKGAFGSVYKANLARSVIQAEATERGEGMLTVRLRQKKHNFGPLAEPFSVKLSFSEDAVTLEAVELKASDLAEEATLTAPERVKLALEDGPAYPWEITETTGVPLKTVKNVLTGLRKQGAVETTGQTEGQAEQVRLSVPRPNVYRDGTRDTGTSGSNASRNSVEIASTDNTDNRGDDYSEGGRVGKLEQEKRMRRLIEQGMSEKWARREVLADDHPLDCDCEVCL